MVKSPSLSVQEDDMRKLCTLFFLFFVVSPLYAGTSAVTATITDADAQTWNNGTFSAIFVPVPGTSSSIYNVNGASFTQQVTGTMNGSGVISVTLTDLSTITPTGGQWQFTICPNASSACYQVITNAVVGATPNLSTQLSTGIRTPRFAAGPTSFGYLDAEVSPTPAPGGEYFNVTSAALRLWNGSAWVGAGGGSGTVSANSGSAGAVANYAAAGGSTTVGPDPNLVDAGNQFVITEAAFQTGNFNGAVGLGLNPGAAVGWCTTAVGNCITTGTTGLYLSPVSTVGTSQMLAVGKSYGTEDALVRSGNACRVTADITLPVNTATTICTWSFPAIAKAWAWQCQIPWVISAGSGTNTLAIIANPSQTPTAATNGSAEIKTTNTNTATEATTAISASGGTTLLTSGTITPAATVFMSSTSGTLLASGTAGTFAIQMTAAGTTATAAAKAGATCVLY
jgi:hypothetical protein